MSTLYLSKSDFKIARTCPTKLYYLKKHYPNTLQDDEYLELMAKGGYMIGKMAQLLYPDGIEIKLNSGLETAIAQTKEHLKKETVILFEPVIVAGSKLIRVDILIKNKNRFDLIEVKSASFSPDDPFLNKNGSIKADWRKGFDDIAFQVITLKEAFPDLRITPHLMLVDTTKRTQIDNLAGLFEIKKVSSYDEGFRGYDVTFTGNAADIIKEKLLIKIDVTNEIKSIWSDVTQTVATLEDSIRSGLKKINTPLSVKCNKCEFTEETPCGFDECWQDLANVTPHIFDLYYGTTIGGYKNPLFNQLISQKKVSLYDIDSDATKGKNGVRQKIQIDYTRKNAEWISPKLKNVMGLLSYPLHFIDFETTRMPLPFHKDMRPYEQIAFQWSCHTLEKPDSAPIHKDWINTQSKFPNFDFARSLMEHLGTTGTVFMWAKHENTVLSEIFRQVQEYNHKDDELFAWLDVMVKKDEDESYTMIDMCELTKDFYFHPEMKGHISLKVVLPAVWKNFPNLKTTTWLAKYYKEDTTGNMLNPYESLPPIDIGEQGEVIRDGTQAMHAYNEMMIGLHRHDTTVRDRWAALLRQYCELDTMAMVVIWEYWRQFSSTA